MSSSFELISHPDRTLKKHLDACNDIAQKQLAMKFIANCFFDQDLLKKIAQILVYFHDFGKATDFFQAKIIDATLEKKDNADFQGQSATYIEAFKQKQKAVFPADWKRKSATERQKCSQHARLGAYFALSCFKDPNQDAMVELIVFKIIRKHHGYLTNFFDDGKEFVLERDTLDLLELQVKHTAFDLYESILKPQQLQTSAAAWADLKQRFARKLPFLRLQEQLKKATDIRYFFLQHLMFSLLLSADKGDMMLDQHLDKALIFKPKALLPPSLISDFKAQDPKLSQNPTKPLNQQREDAYQAIQENATQQGHRSFFSITLPTGMGKTLAAYNAAIILQHAFEKQTNVVPRIVYTLPFTSIIDQNGAILEAILTQNAQTEVSWLSKNHHLARHNEKYDETELSHSEAEYMAEGWEQPMIVTTFVQFLESIFTNQNKKLRKFHNMTNAIFILDEVQAIPSKYYKAIEFVMKKMASFFNTKFLFVTATQPIFFKDETEIIELTDPTWAKTRLYFEGLNRIVIDQKLLIESNYRAMDKTHFQEILMQDIDNQPDKSFLIIVNTVRLAQEIYGYLKAKLDTNNNNLLYLSASILPFQRLKVIKEIKEKTQQKRTIVVSTQVVEAGVDIDLDIVYRDFAPMDSINQSAGRCNRNDGEQHGTVKLMHLGSCQRIYSELLIELTKKILKNHNAIIAENQLFDLNKAYAKAVRARSTELDQTSETMIEAMYHLQLETLESAFQLIEDEDWKCNVFIPYDDYAKDLWSQYENLKTIENPFERKGKLKALKPNLLQYVARFPKNQYGVPKGQEAAFLIYDENWKAVYDEVIGFDLKKESNNLNK